MNKRTWESFVSIHADKIIWWSLNQMHGQESYFIHSDGFGVRIINRIYFNRIHVNRIKNHNGWIDPDENVPYFTR